MTIRYSNLQAEYRTWWGHNPQKPFNWQVFLIWKAQQMALNEPGPFKTSRVKEIACELGKQAPVKTKFPYYMYN